jgi:hypothetical protein
MQVQGTCRIGLGRHKALLLVTATTRASLGLPRCQCAGSSSRLRSKLLDGHAPYWHFARIALRRHRKRGRKVCRTWDLASSWMAAVSTCQPAIHPSLGCRAGHHTQRQTQLRKRGRSTFCVSTLSRPTALRLSHRPRRVLAVLREPSPSAEFDRAALGSANRPMAMALRAAPARLQPFQPNHARGCPPDWPNPSNRPALDTRSSNLTHGPRYPVPAE